MSFVFAAKPISPIREYSSPDRWYDHPKSCKLQFLRKEAEVKDIIQSYRTTIEALSKRRDELCHQRGCCDQRITLLEFEIEEMEEVLRTLAKYDEEEESITACAG